MKKIRVVGIPYGKRKGFHLQFKKEKLAGPFKTWQDAFQARQEWI